MRVVQFYTANKAKGKSKRVQNILSIFVWNEMQGKNLSAKDCAEALGVNVRSAYRYLSEIEDFKKGFSSPF